MNIWYITSFAVAILAIINLVDIIFTINKKPLDTRKRMKRSNYISVGCLIFSVTRIIYLLAT